MTINANERITIKGTLSPLTGKPSSYRAGFFGYETITTPDTNGWYDDDGELNAELITGIEFGSYKSEAPVTWEESDGLSAKDRLEDRINELSIEELKTVHSVLLALLSSVRIKLPEQQWLSLPHWTLLISTECRLEELT
jgi:hypothetical protein